MTRLGCQILTRHVQTLSELSDLRDVVELKAFKHLHVRFFCLSAALDHQKRIPSEAPSPASAQLLPGVFGEAFPQLSKSLFTLKLSARQHRKS